MMRLRRLSKPFVSTLVWVRLWSWDTALEEAWLLDALQHIPISARG